MPTTWIDEDGVTADGGLDPIPARAFMSLVIGNLVRPLAQKRKEAYEAKWRRRMGRKPAPPRQARYWWEQTHPSRLKEHRSE